MSDNLKINLGRFSQVFPTQSLDLSTLIKSIEQCADNIMITDPDATILYVNEAFTNVTGYDREELIGREPSMLNSGYHTDEFFDNMWDTINRGKIFRSTIVNKTKTGKRYFADQTITPIMDENGEITHFISVWKDVSHKIQYQKELERLNLDLKFEKIKLEQILSFDEEVGKIFNYNELIDFIVKQTAEILEAEKCSLMLLDENTNELVIKGSIGIEEEVLKTHKMRVGEGIAGLVAQEGKPVHVEIIDQDERFEGCTRPTYKTSSFLSVPMKFEEKIIGIINVTDRKSQGKKVFTARDLKILTALNKQSAVAIENAEVYRELTYLTVTDPLTNQFNFRYFNRILDHEIKRIKRVSRPLSLVMLDLDEFKKYNDDFGHLAGDRLLKKVGQSLENSIREIDILCRYAGDEFVIILPDTDINDATIVARKMLDIIADLNIRRKITASLGIAQYHDNMTRQDLIAKADAALYNAKNSGKNSISAYQ